jgi:hypothetical protein
MPRQPQVTLSVAHIGPGPRRLDPPADLEEIEAAIFRQTVTSVKPRRGRCYHAPPLSTDGRCCCH